jgi:hypothetical protein
LTLCFCNSKNAHHLIPMMVCAMKDRTEMRLAMTRRPCGRNRNPPRKKAVAGTDGVRYEQVRHVGEADNVVSVRLVQLS